MIAASRPVNKNVNTGAVIRSKRSTDRVRRSQTTGELSNRWNGKIGSHSSVSERTNKSTHSST